MTSDGVHSHGEIQRLHGFRQRAHGNIVHAGFGNIDNGHIINAARGFQQYPAPAELHRLVRLIDAEVVDHGVINTGPAVSSRKTLFSKLDRLFLANARLDIRLGRFQTARRGVEKSLQVNPDGKQAFFLLGEIYRQQGQDSDVRQALKYYNQAIALDPNFVDPHKAIGLIHYKKGQHALAKKFFQSCLVLSPDSPDKAYIEGYLKQCTSSEEG